MDDFRRGIVRCADDLIFRLYHCDDEELVDAVIAAVTYNDDSLLDDWRG